MARDAEKKGAGGAGQRASRFNLRDRPQRSPGENDAYFAGLKRELESASESGGSAAADAHDESSQSHEAVADVTATVEASVRHEGAGDGAAATATAGRGRGGGAGGGGGAMAAKPILAVAAQTPASERVRRSVDSPSSLPSADNEIDFPEFRRRWERFMSEILLNTCEVIFSHTVAKGVEYYDTTTTEICIAVGRKKRRTFDILRDLEDKGFITREEIKVNNRSLGIRIRFHVLPLTR
jgi:hypothetical protein